jgi:hypothetical protein
MIYDTVSIAIDIFHTYIPKSNLRISDGSFVFIIYVICNKNIVGPLVEKLYDIFCQEFCDPASDPLRNY